MNHVLRTGVPGSGDHVTEVIEQPHSTLAAVKKELDQAPCNGFWRDSASIRTGNWFTSSAA